MAADTSERVSRVTSSSASPTPRSATAGSESVAAASAFGGAKPSASTGTSNTAPSTRCAGSDGGPSRPDSHRLIVRSEADSVYPSTRRDSTST